jgi:hypothetical protein
LPFSSILIAVGPGCVFEPFFDAQGIEQARGWLQKELDRMSLDIGAVLPG